MTRRRDLLELLGLGSLAALGGCLGGGGGTDGSGGDGDGPGGEAGPGEGVQSDLARVQGRIAALRTEPTPPSPSYSFDYGRERFSDVKDASITRVVAVSGEGGAGDRLRIRAGEVEAEGLAERLRVAWHVGASEQRSVTIAGESVTFTGGTAAGYAYLIGLAPGANKEVLVGRGTSMDAAAEMIRAFE